MEKTVFGLALCALLFALSASALAQQSTKMHRIGYLAGGGSAPPHAFVQGLRDLGYIANCGTVLVGVKKKTNRINFATPCSKIDSPPRVPSPLAAIPNPLAQWP